MVAILKSKGDSQSSGNEKKKKKSKQKAEGGKSLVWQLGLGSRTKKTQTPRSTGLEHAMQVVREGTV